MFINEFRSTSNQCSFTQTQTHRLWPECVCYTHFTAAKKRQRDVRFMIFIFVLCSSLSSSISLCSVLCALCISRVVLVRESTLFAFKFNFGLVSCRSISVCIIYFSFRSRSFDECETQQTNNRNKNDEVSVYGVPVL